MVEPEDLGMQQIDRVDFNEPISPSLERRVLTTMVSICESYLEQYPTKVEEDETLMRDRSMFGALSRQQRMAVKVHAPPFPPYNHILDPPSPIITTTTYGCQGRCLYV